MNKQQKIEYIRAKCIEANPSIKELVFGCRVKFHPEDGSIIEGIIVERNGTGRVRVQESDCGEIDWMESEDIEKDEILGRDIRLADVLLAIRMSATKNSTYLRDDGVFFHWNGFDGSLSGDHKVRSSYVEWNLKQDNLELQSEECIDFIYNLLK